MTMFSKTSYTESQQAFLAHTYADATKHHHVEGLSILTLDLNPEPLYYKHLLFTTHVLFLQHIRRKPFRPVLLFFTPVPAILIYISFLGRYISIVTLFSPTSLAPERKVARRVNTIPTVFFLFKTTALLTGRGFNESLGNAGGGSGNVASLTAVDARFGGLFRAMNTDGFASNACTKCGTSCNNEDRATQLF